ncbi:hypothetical protein [Agrobacterium cavarae]|uniref:hypothetical protein n=1 Tax=Agrobacterium cavarae TaxID=2528239 RepID=UPI002FDAE694
MPPRFGGGILTLYGHRLPRLYRDLSESWPARLAKRIPFADSHKDVVGLIMTSKKPQMTRVAKIGRLTQSCAEKISAVEGLVLSPRMRRVLAITKDQPAEERRQAVRAQFARKSA